MTLPHRPSWSALCLLAALVIHIWLAGSVHASEDGGWCRYSRAPVQMEFTGELHRGESFVKALGPRLEFRLVPSGYGWDIVIAQPGRSDNFADAVSFPLRWNHTLAIMGWHFTPGEDRPSPERIFSFVLAQRDFNRADKEREVLLWPDMHTRARVKQAEHSRLQLPCGKARVVLSGVETTEEEDSTRADITHLRFSATVSLPR